MIPKRIASISDNKQYLQRLNRVLTSEIFITRCQAATVRSLAVDRVDGQKELAFGSCL